MEGRKLLRGEGGIDRREVDNVLANPVLQRSLQEVFEHEVLTPAWHGGEDDVNVVDATKSFPDGLYPRVQHNRFRAVGHELLEDGGIPCS